MALWLLSHADRLFFRQDKVQDESDERSDRETGLHDEFDGVEEAGKGPVGPVVGEYV